MLTNILFSSELQEAQRELAALRAANAILAAENERLSEELEKTRLLSFQKSSFYVPDFPSVPCNPPNPRSRCVARSDWIIYPEADW